MFLYDYSEKVSLFLRLTSLLERLKYVSVEKHLSSNRPFIATYYQYSADIIAITTKSILQTRSRDPGYPIYRLEPKMETSIVGRPNRDDGPATAVTVTLPAPSTTIKSTPPSQESDDGLIEESTKALREYNDDHQILNLVKYTLRRHLIKIIETPNTFYTLLLDPDLHFSLLSTSDTLLCQLEYKEEPGDLHYHLHKKHKFFPLGRLKAFHRKDKTAMSESYRDLSYLVGLEFSTEPRSLWLIYDYSIEENDDFDGGDPGEHKLYLNQIATDSDSCRLLAHIFDLDRFVKMSTSGNQTRVFRKMKS